MKLSKGLPIFSDIDRDLVDPAAEQPRDEDWRPGNSAAHKLFRCVESLRDVDQLLQVRPNERSPPRRWLKNLVTPIHSLAICLDELLDDCVGNPDTRAKLHKNDAALIVNLKHVLLHKVPLKKGGVLARLRNKATAHIDKHLHADGARSLLENLQPHHLGFWLDVCISVYCDVLKLPIYFWSCKSNDPDVIRVLMAEPFLVSMKLKNGAINELVGSHLITRSPRAALGELAVRVVNSSRWMFREVDPQIRAFHYDSPDSWWAQTLHRMPADLNH
jgi:hypothetical protein